MHSTSTAYIAHSHSHSLSILTDDRLVLPRGLDLGVNGPYLRQESGCDYQGARLACSFQIFV